MASSRTYTLLGIAVLFLVVSAMVPIPHSLIPYAPKDERLQLEDALSHKRGSEWYADFFTQSAKRYGAPHAFELLRTASLPPNLDVHLLAHAVGDVLYEEKGIEGIAVCTEDFRNACSHSIVIGAFRTKGENALSDIRAACASAPGGRGAYAMCFHGLGHGVYASMQYDLEKTITLCSQFATEAHDGVEAQECVGGAIMELVSGGDHDRELFRRVTPQYLRDDDPLYPCTAAYMPKDMLPLCLNYLTPHLLEVVGSSIGEATPEAYRRASALCTAVPHEEGKARDRCFGGFAKEFVVLASGRDIRSTDMLSESQIATIMAACTNTIDSEGVLACDSEALQSLYWGGEHAPDSALMLCALLDTSRGDHCYAELADTIAYYLRDDVRREEQCERLPEKYRTQCLLDTATDSTSPE